MTERTGWWLQAYVDRDHGGMIVWFIDQNGERQKYQLEFSATFWISGPFSRLREAWRFLKRHPIPAVLDRRSRQELFLGEIDVLSVTVDIAQQADLFRSLLRLFPDLDFYDADIMPNLRITAAHRIFPLARCRLTLEGDRIRQIESLDNPWEIDYELPPLRTMTIEPDCDPFHQRPTRLTIETDRRREIHIESAERFILHVRSLIRRFDPDVLVTTFGDAWLFPLLQQICADRAIDYFNPGRDDARPPRVKQGMSYQAYGQIVHRDAQTYLHGRVHIDIRNLTQIYQSGLTGIFEQSRLTGMPLQEGARRSPGAGFSAMQTVTALREGVMVPYRKAQAERPKSATKLLRADQGGLIGQPRIGIHYQVREFDFISMYPSIITRFNLSPETVCRPSPASEEGGGVVPQLRYPVRHDVRGLIPKALQPLVTKRIALKRRIAEMGRRDCRYERLKQMNNAQKSLQTTAFGYMGHKHFRFTQIEVHESITAYSREAMLVTKELLEEAGYSVIHLYVDGLYFKRDRPTDEHEVADLIDRISNSTGLPIGDEGLYKWIVFLPSRVDRQASVPNRFFGAFANGEVKVRGIEARKRDTPAYIKAAQLRVIEVMAGIRLGETLETALPGALQAFREETLRLAQLDGVELASLVIMRVLTRALADYRVDTAVARAAGQLEAAGKPLNKGMRIRYLHTLGGIGVTAWDAEREIRPEMIDRSAYIDLLMRAGETVFQPFGIRPDELRAYALGHTIQLPLPYKAWPKSLVAYLGEPARDLRSTSG